MKVTVNTPLENLPEYSELSGWAKNVCQSGDIFSIGDLLVTTEADLLRKKNCGRRTVEELQSIKMRYLPLKTQESSEQSTLDHGQVKSECISQISLQISDYQEVVPDDVVPLLNRYIGDVEQFVGNILHGNVDGDPVRRFSWAEYLKMQPFLTKVLRIAIAQLVRYGYMDQNTNPDRTATDIVSEASSRLGEFLLLTYPTVVIRNLEIDYEIKFMALSTRTKNVFRSLNKMKPCLPYISGARELKQEDFPKCGDKSYEIFKEFLNGIKDDFNSVLIDMVANKKPEYYLESYCRKYLYLYPFLTYAEQANLAVAEILKQKVPVMNIWRKYVDWNTSTPVRIICDSLGINAEGRILGIHELIEKFGLTRERIRQICAAGAPEDPMIYIVRADVIRLVTECVVSSWDSRWTEINERENIGLTPRQMMALYAVANKDYTLLDAANEVSFLIDRNKIGLVKFRGFLKKLEQVYSLRRYAEQGLDQSDFIRKHLGKSLDETQMRQMCDVLSQYFTQRVDVKEGGGHTLVFSGNSIDKRVAIEQILEYAGDPMSMDEIFVSYNRKYPNDPLVSAKSLHSYLLRNPRIVSLGKRGMYALREWPGIYHGCLKEFIPEILESVGNPITLTELTRRAQERFPDTNEKSVATLLYAEGEDKYILFENNMVGLRGKEYKGFLLPERKMLRRGTFQERFEDFKDFVKSNGRLPYTNRDMNESSLDRWRKNVKTGKIEVPLEQMAQLDEYLESVADLPQNGQEHLFLMKCENVRHVVTVTGALPHNKRNANLYIWLRKAIKSRGTLGDNRDRYFRELVEWLKKQHVKTDLDLDSL